MEGVGNSTWNMGRVRRVWTVKSGGEVSAEEEGPRPKGWGKGGGGPLRKPRNWSGCCERLFIYGLCVLLQQQSHRNEELERVRGGRRRRRFQNPEWETLGLSEETCPSWTDNSITTLCFFLHASSNPKGILSLSLSHLFCIILSPVATPNLTVGSYWWVLRLLFTFCMWSLSSPYVLLKFTTH